MYNTRNIKKLNKNITVELAPDFSINDINNLNNLIINKFKQIKYYNLNSDLSNINIKFNINKIIINDSYIKIYKFIQNNLNLNYLKFNWNNYIILQNQKNEKYQKILNFNNSIINKNIKITNEIQCSICLENFSNQNDVCKTNCNHYFHKNCLQTWSEKKFNCPVCRSDLI